MRPVEPIAVDRLRAVPAVAAAVRRRHLSRDEDRQAPQAPAPRGRAKRNATGDDSDDRRLHCDVVA